MHRRHSPFLLFLAVVSYGCNLFDLWYTLNALELVPTAQEVNPAFRLLLEHPTLAVIYKFSVIPGVLYLLYRLRERRVARLALYLITAGYLALMIYEAWGIWGQW